MVDYDISGNTKCKKENFNGKIFEKRNSREVNVISLPNYCIGLLHNAPIPVMFKV